MFSPWRWPQMPAWNLQSNSNSDWHRSQQGLDDKAGQPFQGHGLLSNTHCYWWQIKLIEMTWSGVALRCTGGPHIVARTRLNYPISLEGKWDFEVVRFSVHYYYPISLEGKWDFEVVRFSVHYYYPISLEGKWDFEVVRFSVHYYYYYYYTCS